MRRGKLKFCGLIYCRRSPSGPQVWKAGMKKLTGPKSRKIESYLAQMVEEEPRAQSGIGSKISKLTTKRERLDMQIKI